MNNNCILLLYVYSRFLKGNYSGFLLVSLSICGPTLAISLCILQSMSHICLSLPSPPPPKCMNSQSWSVIHHTFYSTLLCFSCSSHCFCPLVFVPLAPPPDALFTPCSVVVILLGLSLGNERKELLGWVLIKVFKSLNHGVVSHVCRNSGNFWSSFVRELINLFPFFLWIYYHKLSFCRTRST